MVEYMYVDNVIFCSALPSIHFCLFRRLVVETCNNVAFLVEFNGIWSYKSIISKESSNGKQKNVFDLYGLCYRIA